MEADGAKPLSVPLATLQRSIIAWNPKRVIAPVETGAIMEGEPIQAIARSERAKRVILLPPGPPGLKPGAQALLDFGLQAGE